MRALEASVLYYRYYDMIIYYYKLERRGDKLYRIFEYFVNAFGIANEIYMSAEWCEEYME